MTLATPSPADFPTTARNRVRRLPERGRYDREAIYQVVDASPICHVGFVQDGQPFVLPTIHARMGDTLVLHGAKASRLLKQVAAGQPLCITVTLLDGLVLARSVFHHSMNYRCAILFGRGRLLSRDEEKLAALQAISEHLLPGRWQDARLPNGKELAATSVVAVDIEEASAKSRSGPPGDEAEDYALPVWAGVLPLAQVAGIPQPDPALSAGIPLPPYLQPPPDGTGGGQALPPRS